MCFRDSRYTDPANPNANIIRYDVTTVPNGTYTVTLTTTKPLGSDAETEVWTSPSFTIARP